MRRILAGWVVCLCLALVVAWGVDCARERLLAAGDPETLRILNEDYHWAFVLSPERVDYERRELLSWGFLMYPVMAVVHVPHVAVQWLAPDIAGQRFVPTLSIYLTLGLLSCLFLAARQAGWSALASGVLTAAVLLNPFLLHLLIRAPAIPSTALLPLTYWLLKQRRTLAGLAVLVLFAFSYRFGALFALLFLLATGSGAVGSASGASGPAAAFLGRGQHGLTARLAGSLRRRPALSGTEGSGPTPSTPIALLPGLEKALALFAVLQAVAQVVLLAADNPFGGMEGPKVAFALSAVLQRLQDPFGPEALWRVAEVAAWLAAGGFALALDLRGPWRKLLLGVVLAYLLVATGPFSQSMILFVSMAGIMAAALPPHRPALPPTSPEGEGGQRLRPGRSWAVVLAATLAVGVAAPVFVSSGDGSDRGRVTALRFWRDAMAAPADPHLATVRQVLDTLPTARLCVADPYLMSLLSGRDCETVAPLGARPAAGLLQAADRVLLDDSPKARAFRDATAASFSAPRGWLARYEHAALNARASRDHRVVVLK